MKKLLTILLLSSGVLLSSFAFTNNSVVNVDAVSFHSPAVPRAYIPKELIQDLNSLENWNNTNIDFIKKLIELKKEQKVREQLESNYELTTESFNFSDLEELINFVKENDIKKHEILNVSFQGNRAVLLYWKNKSTEQALKELTEEVK